MNKFTIATLVASKKLYTHILKPGVKEPPQSELDAIVAAQIISEKISDGNPCMIARFGSTELATLVNFLGVTQKDRNIISFIKGESAQWWWNQNIIKQMAEWSGFFPTTIDKIELFCELMIQDMKQVDVLGSWLENERFFEDELDCSKVHLRLLEPFWSEKPWTRVLKGKRVLVIHPFSAAIEDQYRSKRSVLFNNREILPDFSLETIQAVQSLGGDSSFKDWFDALEWMKSEIDKKEYDVCLIGCGAYGFPLAAHVKRLGKVGIHLGGSLQLLFGIRGKRWENPNYGVNEWGIPIGLYSNLMNEHWIRPGIKGRPKNADTVEGACYW